MQLQLIKSDEPDLSLWFLEYIDGADVVFADSFAAFNFVGQLDLTRGDELSNGSQMATVVAGFQVHLISPVPLIEPLNELPPKSDSQSPESSVPF